MFYFGQSLIVVSSILHMIFGLRLHERLKIPSLFFYMIIGTFMESIEKMITSVPSNIIISTVVPKGIEASMLSLTSTIITLNLYTIKSLIGVVVNKLFTHVTNENLENNFWKLYIF